MKKEHIAFIILLAIFFGLKINSFTYSISDENTYYLMGKAVSEGQVMYKDFFFSHPPLQIILFALLIKIFGFSLIILKGTSTIAVAIAAFFIYKTMEEKIGGKEGLIASGLFLFSYDTLRFSSFPTGVELTTMFLCASFYFLINNKFLTSGILSGLAAISGLYAAVGIGMFVLFIFWKHRDQIVRFLLGFALVFATVNIIFLIVAPGYLAQVYFYHLMKPDEAGNKAEMLQRLITANLLLWAAMLAFLLTDRKLKKEIFISIGIVIGYWLFFIISNKAFAYYMLLAFPFAALIGGYSLMHCNIGKRITFAASLALIAISLFFSASQFFSYDYQDFNEAEEIAAYIKQNSVETDKIYGDESITPLLSILSEREIALNHIDSNKLRFTSGITDVNETVGMLRSELKFLIVYKLNVGRGTLSYGTPSLPEFEQLASECNLSKVFKSVWQTYTKEFYIYDCAQS